MLCCSISGEASMYCDSNGLIVQKDGDGGDTAGREGDYWFEYALTGYHGIPTPGHYLYIKDEFERVLELLQRGKGIFVRNPIKYNDPSDMSRDQTVPLILAMGQMEEYDILKALFYKQVRNFGRYQNGDIGFIGDLGYYIRAFKFWKAYPILLVGDLQLLVNSIIRCIKGRDLNDVSDDINLTLELLQAQYNLPTPISWLARKIYKHLRYGQFFPEGAIQRAWNWYFRPETNANPFDELYRSLIEKM